MKGSSHLFKCFGSNFSGSCEVRGGGFQSRRRPRLHHVCDVPVDKVKSLGVQGCASPPSPVDHILHVDAARDDERRERRVRRWGGGDDGGQLGPPEKAAVTCDV